MLLDIGASLVPNVTEFNEEKESEIISQSNAKFAQPVIILLWDGGNIVVVSNCVLPVLTLL